MSETNNEAKNMSEDSQWGYFEMGGEKYEFELWEALELCGEIANKHRDDLNECLDCFNQFADTRHEGSPPEGWKETCPSCKSDNLRPDQSFVDSTAKMITEKYGVPKCSRNEARQFTLNVELATKELKKSTTTTPK